MDRINAVANDAEKEREDVIARTKRDIRDVYEKTGKKTKWDSKSVAGGEKVVKEMMEPTTRTIRKATTEYKKALIAEGVDAS